MTNCSSGNINKKTIKIRYDELLDLTSIDNIEKSIWRHKNKNIRQIPTNLNELRECFQKEEEWQRRLCINDMDTLLVQYITYNNKTEAVIFIDKCLKDIMNATSLSTIFLDGTFATMPKLQEHNLQLWTILIRHKKRVSTTIFLILIVLIFNII